jgi:hypothetical protein
MPLKRTTGLSLSRMRIESQEEIAGLNVGAKLAESKGKLDAKQEAEGLRMGIEIAREAQQSEQPGSSYNRRVTNE